MCRPGGEKYPIRRPASTSNVSWTYFGRRNTNFGSSVNVYTTVGFTGQCRTNSVDNTHAKCPSFQAIPQRQDCVRSFATLAHKYADVISEYRGFTVQKVTSKLDAD